MYLNDVFLLKYTPFDIITGHFFLFQRPINILNISCQKGMMDLSLEQHSLLLTSMLIFELRDMTDTLDQLMCYN